MGDGRPLKRRGFFLGAIGALTAAALAKVDTAKASLTELGETLTYRFLGKGTALEIRHAGEGIALLVSDAADGPPAREVAALQWNYSSGNAAAQWIESVGGHGSINIAGAYSMLPKLPEGLITANWMYSKSYVAGWAQGENVAFIAVAGDYPDHAELEPSALHVISTNGSPAACVRGNGPVALEAMSETAETTALMATNEHGGTALMVHGRTALGTVFEAVLEAGEASVFVRDPGATEGTTLTVVPCGSLGPGNGFWVEVHPGKGYMINTERAVRRDVEIHSIAFEAAGTTHHDHE